jgi:hypothetical protein
MERPLRLIAANPLDALARVVEALLVVASAPAHHGRALRSGRRVGRACRDRAQLLGEPPRRARRHRARARRRRLGIPRLTRRGRRVCALFERPVQRGLSPGGAGTLAIVAYLGPVSRPRAHPRSRGLRRRRTARARADRGAGRTGWRRPLRTAPSNECSRSSRYQRSRGSISVTMPRRSRAHARVQSSARRSARNERSVASRQRRQRRRTKNPTTEKSRQAEAGDRLTGGRNRGVPPRLLAASAIVHEGQEKQKGRRWWSQR